jgi:hypothetical protein
MGNGIPPALSNGDYNVIKGGTLITVGHYSGCIQVGDDHYWVENKGSDWYLHSDDVDDELISYITADVWDRCKERGSYSWNARGEYWEDNGDDYRWDGPPGDDLYLVKL